MNKLLSGFAMFFLCIFISFNATAIAEEEIYSPSERPANAPQIKKFIKDDDYFDKALEGVEKPYPASLMFLKDQGAWYSPFIHPGMLGYYDIRGWHRKNQKLSLGADKAAEK